jgi:hypothetical protein
MLFCDNYHKLTSLPDENHRLTVYLFSTFRNCYCTHLMQYVLAKMLFATKRLQQSLRFDPSILMLHGDDEVQIQDPDPSRRGDDDSHEIAGDLD